MSLFFQFTKVQYIERNELSAEASIYLPTTTGVPENLQVLRGEDKHQFLHKITVQIDEDHALFKC